jgi:WD40 repeat protein
MSAKECVHSFDTAHTDQIWSVAYNTDGAQLVSAGDDGVLQIYDIAAA